jgi:hypothetical protein
MSFFPNLFASTNKMTSWLMQVGAHDEVVIYRLNENGQPEHFACGKTKEVLNGSLSSSDRALQVVSIDPMLLLSCFGRESSWQEVADSLNGKGVKHAKAYAAKNALFGIGIRLGEYVKRNPSDETNWVVGPKGKLYDDKRNREIAELNASLQKQRAGYPGEGTTI